MVRFLDIIISVIILLLLLLPLLLIFIVLKLTGEGKVFFLQDRVGKYGKIFKVFKLATMYENSPFIGSGEVTIKNDNRILPFGHFLRNLKINEFPQFGNVLLGHMSIIGPRPQTQRCFDAFPKEVQKTLLKVEPGISGIGSIVFANEDEFLHHENYNDIYDKVIMPYKGELEKWYIKNKSLKNYLKLIILTGLIIIIPNNKLVWKFFDNLPQPEGKIKKILKNNN